MLELAQMEADELTERQDQLVERLEVQLIPKDPQDDHNAIVEIRGAAGEMKVTSSQVTFIVCILAIVTTLALKLKS